MTHGWRNNPGRSSLLMVAAVLAFSVVLGGLWLWLQSWGISAAWAQVIGGSRGLVSGTSGGLILVLFGAVVGVWAWWTQRKILILATSDGLTVKKRPGDVYPFKDAKLGTWGMTGGMTMGTALHLQCGRRRFILGGRDHRVAAGTRLEAPDVGYGLSVDVDARVSASDFEEILTMAGLRSRAVAVRPRARGEATRCLLFANSDLIREMGSFALREKREFLQSLNQPRLAIDIGAGAIRVIDPNTNELIASASPAQVTATSVTYRLSYLGMFWVLVDFHNPSRHKEPFMRVSVPGMPPLTIGCRCESLDPLDRPFSWHENVPAEHARIDYVVSVADWPTLVERLGLVTYLKEKRWD